MTKSETTGNATVSYQPNLAVEVILGQVPDGLKGHGQTPQRVPGFPGPAVWSGSSPTVSSRRDCKPHEPCTGTSSVSTPGGELFIQLPHKALLVSVAGSSNDFAVASATANIVIPKL